VHMDIYMYEMLTVGARSNSPRVGYAALFFFAYVDTESHALFVLSRGPLNGWEAA
jgi:hypothetical protein